MLHLLRRYRELIGVVALLAVPLVLYVAGTKDVGQRNIVDRGILTVFAPVQKAVTWAIEGGQDLWYGYIYLVDVREENLALRAESLVLRGRVAAVDEVLGENERLRRLLAFRRAVDRDVVPAPLIAIAANPALSRTVRIGKGTRDGVRPPHAVVTPEGVVGRVVAAGPGWADVMLIADPNSYVAAVVSRSRARLAVRGTGALDEQLVEHALRTDDLEDGDLLVTSGTGGIYPKGLHVGRLSAVKRPIHGMFQTARLVPSVDLSRIEEVLVLIPSDPDESAGGAVVGVGAKP